MSDMSMAFAPKYFALAEQLRQQIVSGKFKQGDQITSEPVLCKEYNLSRGTVRQAIQLLVDEGLLVREHGRGTFVASSAERSQHFSLSSFADEMRRQRRQPSTVLLANELLMADSALAEKLAVPLATPLFHIKRLRLADGRPVVVETRYLAESLCPQLATEDLQNVSLHWLFVQKYQIPLVRMEHVVEIEPISASEAELLRIPAGSPAFHVDRLTFTSNEAGDKVPAVWFQAIYSQENYHIQTNTL